MLHKLLIDGYTISKIVLLRCSQTYTRLCKDMFFELSTPKYEFEKNSIFIMRKKNIRNLFEKHLKNVWIEFEKYLKASLCYWHTSFYKAVKITHNDILVRRHDIIACSCMRHSTLASAHYCCDIIVFWGYKIILYGRISQEIQLTDIWQMLFIGIKIWQEFDSGLTRVDKNLTRGWQESERVDKNLTRGWQEFDSGWQIFDKHRVSHWLYAIYLILTFC